MYPIPGWTWTETGERNVYIDYNLEANPLQIRTDSLIGSEEMISVAFYTEDDNLAGAVKIKFTDPPMVNIDPCMDYINFEPEVEQVRN